MLVELITPSGWKFLGKSFVTVNGKDYPLDELSKKRRDYVLAVRDVNALNAAFAGKAEFRAEGLPEFKYVFPELETKSEIGER